MAQIMTLPQTAIAQAIAAGSAQQKADKGMAGKYDEMAHAVAVDGTDSDGKAVKIASAALVSSQMAQFVFGYCKAAGIACAVSADGKVTAANADAMTVAAAKYFAELRGKARSRYLKGMEYAYGKLGIVPPPKQNAGGRKAAEKPADDKAADGKATPEKVDPINVSILSQVRQARERLEHFGKVATLNVDDREEFGKMSECMVALFIMLETGVPVPPAPAAK